MVMSFSKYAVVLVWVLGGTFSGFSQNGQGKYWVQFTDKNSTPYSITQPAQFLSVRSIERRQRQNIPVVKSDLPVDPSYINAIASIGVHVRSVSKWLNSVVVDVDDTLDLPAILALPFVKQMKQVGVPSKGAVGELFTGSWPKFGVIYEKGSEVVSENTKGDGKEVPFDYGSSLNQIRMIKGDVLHARGYRGKGLHIAVLDAGFYRVDTLPAFDSLWDRGLVAGSRDFVDPGGSVYGHSTHGTMVLSTMGALLPGEIIGTAPEATYWLLRSEDAGSEYPVEEDYWVAAAEYADSVGVDIINSSLGYTIFDQFDWSHTYGEMDGNTAHSTIGADLAASKGILVVVSAGNSGGSFWQYIGAPADGDSVLAVGAVDMHGNYADFSSTGPASDGRLKPEVVTQGLGTVVCSVNGGVFQGNGTSFASPVMAGAAATLWQAHPGVSNMEIYQAIIKSASQYSHPDDWMGYGIPDLVKADVILRQEQGLSPDENTYVYPNPSSGDAVMHFYLDSYSQVRVELMDAAGKFVTETLLAEAYPGENILHLPHSSELASGLYLIRFYTSEFFGNYRWLKF